MVTSLLCSTGTLAGPQERQQAKRIHDRLAGTLPTNQMLDDLEQIILTSGTEAAALHVIDNNPAFYNVTLKNFAAPWTNEAQDVFVPLNDYSATVIGMIRDDIDFRRVLFGDHLYVGASGLVGLYTPTNNNHYEALERLGPVAGDLSNNTVLVASSQTSAQTLNLPANATAGVMTTRAAAEAFFSGGTNRAMLRFTFMNHLCTDFEPLKDTSRVPDRVRRDVTRSPGGDSRIYMNNCVACHAGMDGLAGAFAYYEYDITTGELQYSNQVANYNANFDQNGVSLKHNINPNNFKYGFVTTDDSWINYWRHGSNYLLGWDRNNSAPAPQDENFHTYGNGAQSLGRELAHTRAFSTCQVKKVFRAVCLKDADVFAADRLEVNTIADGFEVDGNMKNVFARVAAYCSTAQ
ncbi:MAG: hypothetical protein EP315_00260 [Gammaproteobacteria bacterium]|nr:MAG: hypothetical protein EP315_00260 [Gammaproteobacteria bacterium]